MHLATHVRNRRSFINVCRNPRPLVALLDLQAVEEHTAGAAKRVGVVTFYHNWAVAPARRILAIATCILDKAAHENSQRKKSTQNVIVPRLQTYPPRRIIGCVTCRQLFSHDSAGKAIGLARFIWIQLRPVSLPVLTSETLRKTTAKAAAAWSEIMIPDMAVLEIDTFSTRKSPRGPSGRGPPMETPKF